MSGLVFRSMHDPELFSIAVEPRPVGVRFKVDVPSWAAKGVTISFADARQLRDFLNKELSEQASEPSKPAKVPQLILAWQHPANGRRFIQVSSELVATQSAVELRHNQPDFPIWLAQITKQFVQTTPSYEWKDL